MCTLQWTVSVNHFPAILALHRTSEKFGWVWVWIYFLTKLTSVMFISKMYTLHWTVSVTRFQAILALQQSNSMFGWVWVWIYLPTKVASVMFISSICIYYKEPSVLLIFQQYLPCAELVWYLGEFECEYNLLTKVSSVMFIPNMYTLHEPSVLFIFKQS